MVKGGRFYRAGADNATADVCIAFDLERGRIHASSTDAYKLGMAGIGAKFEEGDRLKQLTEAMQKEEKVCQKSESRTGWTSFWTSSLS